jgi:hypothetical protein
MNSCALLPNEGGDTEGHGTKRRDADACSQGHGAGDTYGHATKRRDAKACNQGRGAEAGRPPKT